MSDERKIIDLTIDSNRARLEKAIAGAIKNCIHSHGPITDEWVSSASKRVISAIKQFNQQEEERKKPKLYVLRLWDYYDGWSDVSGPLPHADANALWLEKTRGGTYMAKEDFKKGYYCIFPANTKMIYNSEVMDG